MTSRSLLLGGFAILGVTVLCSSCARTARFVPHPVAVAPAGPAVSVAPVPALHSPRPWVGMSERVVRGEQLQCTATWFGIPVLRGEFRVAETPIFHTGRPHVSVTARIVSTGLVRRIFSVDDRMTSLIDPHTLVPAQSELVLQHRSAVVAEAVVFDQVQHQATSTSHETAVLSIPPAARDLLSALCYLRSADLTEGQVLSADIVAHGRLWHLVATVRDQGVLILDQGTFPVVAIDVQGSWLEQVVHHQTLKLWLTTDPSHTPLMLQLRMPFIGSIIALLDDRQPAWPPPVPAPPPPPPPAS